MNILFEKNTLCFKKHSRIFYITNVDETATVYGRISMYNFDYYCLVQLLFFKSNMVDIE